MTEKQGKVWLVGAGPFDPGLITVKGLNVLKNADVVVYDKLVGVEILNFISSTAKKINVGKQSLNHIVPQDEINKILLEEAMKGNNVVRLKGGDPFLFGRGGEELELLAKHHIPFEVIPGITSAISVPAYAGIPVTHRDFCSSLHIITGHTKLQEEPNMDFEALVKLKGTLAFLMSVSSIGSICNGLLKAGMSVDMPCAVIEQGTSSRQRKVLSTLQMLPNEATDKKIKAPAIIIIGEVCSLSEDFEWVTKRPLHGKRIIVTRAENQCSTLSEKIRSLGGESIEFPCIKAIPIQDDQLLQEAIENISSYHWVVFTSAIGAEFFFKNLMSTDKDIRALYNHKIAVIGKGTQQIFSQRDIKIDLIPENYNAKSLAFALCDKVVSNENVLILRAKDGTPDLIEILSQNKIQYLDVPVYETIYSCEDYPFSREVIESGDFDLVTFTSASTVQGFVNTLPSLDFKKITAICIGEQTEIEAKKYGMKTIVSKESTIDSLVEAMI